MSGSMSTSQIVVESTHSPSTEAEAPEAAGFCLARSVLELRRWRTSLCQTSPGKTVGLIPTMGALHDGHLSLIRQSQASCDYTAVSIFVNPIQFGPTEDFASYPRPFERDLELLRARGVNLLFAPEPSDVFFPDSSTYVVEEKVSQPLCGALRPGHFRGVTTIVLKLFNLVQPDFAFFGQKDAQQCAVIERMVRDLNVPVTIVRGKTVREKDGLAMSSRNAYLSPDERTKAPLIHQSMEAVQRAYQSGERDVSRLIALGKSVLEREPMFRVQYWELRDASTMESLEGRLPDACGEARPGLGALIMVAAYLGKTRLIDNCFLAM